MKQLNGCIQNSISTTGSQVHGITIDVPDKYPMMDNVSIVSCSTQKSDVTQNLEVPDLRKNTEIMHIHEIYRISSLETSKESVPRDADASELSPLVPVQSTAFTQVLL
ncbi:uncharacterized protein LOC128547601 [Mercenaria mercenaria]|uniref:uncharacterized protein LOC128547601 n=1 Tax=Mercenaria mercenaria TaxID=6596 RepID=UPI00234F83D9|nr:uncharacterized protein LOC128547601 [Mercenaria mercenaria]